MAEQAKPGERPGWREMVTGGREMTGLAWRAAPLRTVLSLALQPAGAALTVLSGLWLKVITDAVVAADRPGALRGAAAMAGSLGLSRVMAALGLRTTIALGERTAFAMEDRLARALTSVPTLEIFERPDQLDRLDLLRQQSEFYAYTLNALAQGLREAVRLASTLVLLATVDLRLLALVVVGAPSLVSAVRARLAGDDAQVEVAERRRLAGHLLDVATTAGPAREVRVFGLESEISRRWESVQSGADDILVEREWRASLRSLAAWLPFGAGFVAVVGLVVASAVDGHATPGDVVLVVTVARSLVGNLGSVATWSAQVAAALRFLARYVQVSRFAADLAVGAAGAPAPAALERGISFRRVSFAYPGADEPVLHDIDLLLPAGSTVALVGENGAGKSTLVKLLCRLYEPTAGHLDIDGQPLHDIDLDEWRAACSAGFQDFARFELVAREAVGVGDLAAIDDEVAIGTALRTAGAGNIINQLDSGLATMLGKSWGGTDLSTGQWQLLALGRAMMRRHPLLLVLDEPTASLDAEAEHRLFELYAEQSRVRAGHGAITVIVSHRFSTVRAADLIVVLSGGRIIETGSHDDLIDAGGTYAELFTLQAGAYRP